MPKAFSWFRICMVGLYLTGSLLVVYFLFQGRSYYLTPFADRPHHPDYGVFRPAGELGLRFGIAGSLLLFSLLAYSIRRRTRLLGLKIPLKYWLEIHIFCGVLGPLLIVLHTSFRWGGLVSLSFWSMVGVALSGLFGRYLYVQIPHDLYGRELEVGDVSRFESELQTHLSQFSEVTTSAVTALLNLVQGGSERRTDLFHMLSADLTRFWGYFRARRLLSQLQLPAARSEALLQGLKTIESKRRVALRYRAVHKLLHQWHVIHRPFALIMYLIMLIHIAVALLFAISWR